MYDTTELCEKIVDLYPDIGSCGLDVNVEYDDAKGCWRVKLVKDNHSLEHYLEKPDAEQCMQGRQCVSLGLEIAQLKNLVEGKGF